MAIHKLFKKKKKLGFQEKPRSRDEINQEYSHHAAMHGHNVCLMAEAQQKLEEAQKTVDHHLEQMLRIRREGAKLPLEPPKDAETPEEPKPA